MTQIQDLSNRVTALDGIGAQVPSRSAVPAINTDLNGLHNTMNQLTLVIQAQLNEIAAVQTSLQAQVTTLLANGSQTLVIAESQVTNLVADLAAKAIVVAPPLTATSTGLPGQIAQDGSFLYICTAVNVWKRVAIATF